MVFEAAFYRTKGNTRVSLFVLSSMFVRLRFVSNANNVKVKIAVFVSYSSILRKCMIL